jgi:hypothetical protein
MAYILYRLLKLGLECPVKRNLRITTVTYYYYYYYYILILFMQVVRFVLGRARIVVVVVKIV